MKYSYVCSAKHEFEEDHAMGSAPADPQCPHCGARSRRDYTSERKGIEFAWKPALGTRTDRKRDHWGGMKP